MKKRILTLVFSCIFIFLLQAQDDVHYVAVKAPEYPVDDWEFRCGEVIDARRDTSNMGYVHKGSHQNPLPTKIKGGLEKTMKDVLSGFLLQVIPARPKLVFIFHEVQISESRNSNSQHGFCKVEVEIARKEEGKLYSLGIFEAEANNHNKLDATKSHGKRIRKALKGCLKAFNKTDWQNDQGRLIDADALSYTYNFKNIPPRGLYRSYGDLAKHNHVGEDNFNVQKVATSQKYDDQYFLELVEDKLASQIRYVSDGRSVFIYAGKVGQRPIYLRAEQHGRYWFFTTRYSNPEMGAIFGLLGSIASYKGRTLYFDTETKKMRELNDYQVFKLTKKEHPEILKAYKKSKRKMKDRAEVIRQLNAKYLSNAANG